MPMIIFVLFGATGASASYGFGKRHDADLRLAMAYVNGFLGVTILTAASIIANLLAQGSAEDTRAIWLPGVTEALIGPALGVWLARR